MKHKVFRSFFTLILVIGLVAVQASFSVHAAGPWYVATTGDDLNDCFSPSTPCATINAAIGKATDGDTIKVATGTYTGSSNIVVFINKNVTISGGWDSSFVQQDNYSTIDSQMAPRIGVYISGLPVKTAQLDRFIIANGKTGVYNSGILTISNSTIHNNSNVTEGSGGGIQTYNNLTLINVTVSNNSAGRGGGIYSVAGSISLNNATVANNSAIYVGGGIFHLVGSSSLSNTLIADNIVTGQNSSNDCYGPLSSSGYNLIGDTSDCIITLTSSDLANVDPLLGPLQDNGGSALTHALLAGSPAIDAGDNATCEATDQRGVARPQGVACDIGAFEFEFDNQSETVTIDFPVQGLPFPNGTNITTEYSDQGILFSSDDSDLPPEYQKSLGAQENYIGANEGADGTFYNLFRLIFIATGTVTEVSVTLIDSNSNPQAHTLIAFDAAGNIVDVDSFTEDDLFPDPFILTVSSSGGIAYVVAIEQPYGAEILNRISYTIEREVKLDVSIDIKPGSDTNPINLNSRGKIPVAILSTVDFDAPSMLDTTSLTFGKTEDEAGLAFCNNGTEDVNEDGLFDLVCHFYTQAAGFQIGDLEGILKGETVEGTPIEGRDTVTILD